MSKKRLGRFFKSIFKVPAHYLYIALGGSIGAVTRIFIFAIVTNQILATFLCNIIGTFLLACVIQMERYLYPELRNSIVVGFCGGLSIFASFSKDSVLAVKDGDYFLFFANFFANFAFCIASVFLAIWISSLFQKTGKNQAAVKS